jgi:hypothetical protein
MSLETFLTFVASFGGAMFVMKFVLMLTSGDSDMADDIHDHSNDAADDTVKSFLAISLQTAYAAMMVGGLLGLTAISYKLSYDQILGSTVIGALLGGGLSSLTMRFLKKLNSANTRQEPTVGDQGVAYLPMEDLRVGQVMIVVNGREELFEAYSRNGLIRAFEAVKVVGKQNNRLIVESLNP